MMATRTQILVTALVPVLSALAPMLAFAGPVTLSETINLTSRAAESVAVVIDDQGRAQVVSVIKDPRSLERVTVAPDGQLDREVIDSHPSSGDVSVAFGSDGRLYVANGGRVLVNAEGRWKPLDDSPPCEQLVRAGSDLACAFVVKGGKLGISGHWEFYVFGAAMGCCLPFAWHFQTEKLVIARRLSPGWTWTVMDGADRRNIVAYSLAGSRDGTLHVLYDVVGASAFMGAQKDAEEFYARLQMDNATSPGANRAATLQSISPRDYARASGRSLGDWTRDSYSRQGGKPCLAVDWESSEATLDVGGGQVYVAKSEREIVPTGSLEGLRCDAEGTLAVDASGRLHSVVRQITQSSNWSGPKAFELCYLAHDSAGWSEPLDLGGAAKSPRAHLATHGDGATLAVWVQPDGRLGARWIQRASMESSDPMRPAPRSGTSAIAGSACAGAGYAAGEAASDLRARRQRAMSMPRLGITLEAAQQLVPPDEHVERVFARAVWYGETPGLLARTRKQVNGDAPIGDMVVADKSLLFAGPAGDEADRVGPAPTVRIAYHDVDAFRLGTMVLNRWVIVRSKNGHEYYFAILRGDGVIDRDATQAAVDLLRSKLPSH